MHKRGQVTLFVIIGVVIVLLIALAVVYKTNLFPLPGQSTTAMRSHITECFANTIGKGITHTAFTRQGNLDAGKKWLEAYVNEQFIIDCADLSSYAGAIGDTSTISTTITFDGTTFNTITSVKGTLHYPITITRGNQEQHIDTFTTEVRP